jgi:hypothetical protein
MLGLGRLFDAIPISIPIDHDTDQAGDQFSLQDAGGVDVMLYTGDGDTGRDIQFTVKRHTDMGDASGTTIDLSAIAHPHYYYKQHGTTVVGVGTWSKGDISDDNGADVVLDAAEGENSSLIFFHIDKSDLGEGYSALSISVKIAGSSAKIACCLAFLTDLAVQRAPQNLRSALA